MLFEMKDRGAIGAWKPADADDVLSGWAQSAKGKTAANSGHRNLDLADADDAQSARTFCDPRPCCLPTEIFRPWKPLFCDPRPCCLPTEIFRPWKPLLMRDPGWRIWDPSPKLMLRLKPQKDGMGEPRPGST